MFLPVYVTVWFLAVIGPQVHLVVTPDLHMTVPTSPSVEPLGVTMPPLDGLVSTDGPWIQYPVLSLRMIASSSGNQLSTTAPNLTRLDR